MLGRTLAHYEVVSRIGQGGMGEVYRARDTRLGREVALKILPREMSGDPERIARFQREARTLATLQHPNVASIYGFEDLPEARFLVMELVEGEDLAERLARGALPLDEALEITRQITEGLEAAHAQGVVHRDLKPANVKIAPDGRAKILDFGLARAISGEPTDEGDPATSPTITAAMTQAGTILGTAAYMAPEQARGRAADRRADIWALGVMLYEMLTGQRLFDGETVSDTLALVLTRAVDLDALPADTPLSVRRVLARCLARDPRERWRDAGDVRIEVLSPGDPVAAAVAPASGGGRWLALAAALAIAALGLGWVLGRIGTHGPAATVVRLSVPDAGYNSWSTSAISDDGQQIAWVPLSLTGEIPLQVRSLDSFDARPMAGATDAYNPAFSPDGRWIAFCRNADQVLYKVAIAGGAPQRLTDTGQSFVNLHWAEDQSIYFAGGGGARALRGISRIDASGGEPVRIVEPTDEETMALHPWRVVGTPWMLFTAELADGYVVRAVSLESGERVDVIRSASTPRFLEPDIVIAHRPASGDVVAVRVDRDSMEPLTEPIPMLEGVITGVMLRGSYDLSREGDLIYTHGAPGDLLTTGLRHLVWVDEDGKETLVFQDEASWAEPRISPDGEHLLVRGVETPNCSLWNYDVRRGTLSRIVFEEDAHSAIWNTANGDVLFRHDEPEGFYVLERNSDGTGESRVILDTGEVEASPSSISADGRWLVLDATSNQGDVWVYDMQGDEPPVQYLSGSFRERNGAISPDGRWIAYTSNASGRDEVYVQGWPDPGRRTQISTEGGVQPLWARDGRRLYYLTEDRLMSVDLDFESGLRASTPRFFATLPIETAAFRMNYDITADGERILGVSRPTDEGGYSELRVVLGWADEVRAQLARR